MNNAFFVEKTEFKIDDALLDANGFSILSSPRLYSVNWRNRANEVVTEIVEQLNEQPANFLLVDANVYELFFKGRKVDPKQLFLLDANEENKNIQTVLQVIDNIQQLSPSKNNTLFVVGGGITQDIGAFAACIYKRGFPWKFYPTTLLSMCDSCIGGKTGINYKNGKNQLALFSAPRQVDICPEFLHTLDERDIVSGYGEILKLLITGGYELTNLYSTACDATGIPQKSFLKQLILGALIVKKAVIEKDEFELDLRRSLNYGHTLGHAIEVMSNFKIPHGQAVALGVAVIGKLGVKYNITSPEAYEYIYNLAQPLLKDIDAAWFDWNSLSDLLQKDKKTEKDGFVFVLVREPGDTVFVKFPKTPEFLSELLGIIKEIVQ